MVRSVFRELCSVATFDGVVTRPRFLVVCTVTFVLLCLNVGGGCRPLLLVPVTFKILLTGFPNNRVKIIRTSRGNVMVIGKTLGGV